MILDLFKIKERLGTRGWRSLLEGRRRLLGLLLRAQLSVFGNITKQNSLAAYAMCREILRIGKKSGILFLGQYLKHVALNTMWFWGGYLPEKPEMKVFVSLTKSGIPRFIPPYYRKILRGRSPRANLVIRFVLSVCSLHKLLLVWPKGNKVKADNIQIPKYMVGFRTMTLSALICHFAPMALERYTKGKYKSIPIRLGFKFKPSWSSGPNTWMNPKTGSSPPIREMVKRFSIWHTLSLDAFALYNQWNRSFLASAGKVWLSNRTVYPIEGKPGKLPFEVKEEDSEALKVFLDRVMNSAGDLFWSSTYTRPENGRFGVKLEGAGKIRVFAICNPILQTLVRPLQDWCMDVLRLIKTDGTFDQLRPISALSKYRLANLFSYDLKAATDNMPAVLSGAMLYGIFGRDLSKSWIDILTTTRFRIPTHTYSVKTVRFNKGQPLGFYSSWPVFALTHHILVWIAAWMVDTRMVFKKYAILGDDLVIGCPKVAREYLKLLRKAEVSLSKEKSLISRTGAMEFAKHFIVQGVDLSPVSLRLLNMFSGFVAAYHFKSLQVSLQTSIRLRGGGYRVYSNPNFPKGKGRRWKRHWLLAHSPSGIFNYPILWWLTLPERGAIDPYRIGAVRSFLLKKVSPGDFSEKSLESVWVAFREDEDLFEVLFLEWFKSHLNYLHWYARVYFDYNIPFEELLNPPTVCYNVDRSSYDSKLYVKYGLLFQAWECYKQRSPLPINDQVMGKESLFIVIPLKFRCRFNDNYPFGGSNITKLFIKW